MIFLIDLGAAECEGGGHERQMKRQRNKELIQINM